MQSGAIHSASGLLQVRLAKMKIRVINKKNNNNNSNHNTDNNENKINYNNDTWLNGTDVNDNAKGNKNSSGL